MAIIRHSPPKQATAHIPIVFTSGANPIKVSLVLPRLPRRNDNADAIIVDPGPFFRIRRAQLVVEAARHGIPAIYVIARTSVGVH